MDWHNRTQVKKGDYGEQIIDDYLKSKGIIPYASVIDGPHPFDRLCVHGLRLVIVEVKAKPHREYYPDTGINISQYEKYKAIQEKHGLDLYIYFVDEKQGEIYGNKLSILDAERIVENKNRVIKYPKRERGIIYFPLEAMKLIASLTMKQCEKQKSNSSRNPAYDA